MTASVWTWLSRGLALGMIFLAIASAAPPQPQSASPAEAAIARLIEQLGDEDFAARERAQADLAKLGLEAFDALHAAQNHHDPEIALRARYLVRSMNVRWFSEADSPEVMRILKNYGEQSEGERRSRMDKLAMLDGREGLVPLCRLSRFETIETLAKYGALKVLETEPPADPAARRTLAETIHRIVGSSRRPAAVWLRQYAEALADPAATLAEWDRVAQAEQAALEKAPDTTTPEIVRDLHRYQIELLSRLGKSNEAQAVIRRTFDLIDGTPEQVQELIDWLMQRKRWPMVLEAAEKFAGVIQDQPMLLYCLAETHRQLGDEKRAEEIGAKALALRPESPDEHLRIGWLLEQERGLSTWAEREYREVLKAAVPGTRQDFRARFHLSELLHDQLKELAAAEALKPVVDLLKKDEAARETCVSANRTPESVISRMNYFFACYYRDRGDKAKERQRLEAAVEADPEDADVLIAMFRLAGADEAWQASTKQRIREVAGKSHDRIEQYLTEVELAGSEQLKAATEYALSIECNQYAWLVANTFGDFDEAIKLSHKSLELRPAYPGYLDTLGRCYYAKGDLAKAVKYQAQAVKLNGYSGQIRRQLELFVKEAKAKGIPITDEELPPASRAAIERSRRAAEELEP